MGEGGRADDWTDGGMDGRTDGPTKRLAEEKRVNRGTGGERTDGRTDGFTDRRIDRPADPRTDQALERTSHAFYGAEDTSTGPPRWRGGPNTRKWMLSSGRSFEDAGRKHANYNNAPTIVLCGDGDGGGGRSSLPLLFAAGASIIAAGPSGCASRGQLFESRPMFDSTDARDNGSA